MLYKSDHHNIEIIRLKSINHKSVYLKLYHCSLQEGYILPRNIILLPNFQ